MRKIIGWILIIVPMTALCVGGACVAIEENGLRETVIVSVGALIVFGLPLLGLIILGKDD